MPTWDTYEDIRAALDLYVGANPGYHFILVMVQTSDDGERAYAKAHGALGCATAVVAADEALSELMGFAAAVNGVEGFEDDGEDGEQEEGFLPPNDLSD